ncbi:SixA phosphatase family protein [Nocardioides sp. Kera G14]|uniref:SixA phosphatase family protein n=1 Tax=Nocardioides sp. Kera G14 TaxID=2884264 RepID=UPI001D11ECFA|nr:histidine phosphatase family protein [Nocardioides sp. Kera G14]UDY25139.1 histidine phosphatase family protein [Nocardioides sp. Kera G14]
MTRTLVIIRHAKAEQFGSSDHERPLTARGESDAAAAGRWLYAEGIVPEQALVSTALRTRETYAAIAEAAGWVEEPWVDATLYEAGVDTVLELVHALEDDTQTAVIVGHNPAMGMVAQLLHNGSGVPLGEFATSAIAVFECDGDWASLDVGSARLRAFEVPRS